MSETLIANRLIGPGHPTFVIAELSANHNHDLARALASIDAAAEAGVDAVKFQTYTADTITIDSDAEPFQVREARCGTAARSMSFTLKLTRRGSGTTSSSLVRELAG